MIGAGESPKVGTGLPNLADLLQECRESYPDNPVQRQNCSDWFEQCNRQAELGRTKFVLCHEKDGKSQCIDVGDAEGCVRMARFMAGNPALYARPGQLVIDGQPVAARPAGQASATTFVEELPELGPGENELDLRLSPVESEYLKHKAFFFRKFTSNVQGNITRVHVYENPFQFFKGILDIYIDGSTPPRSYSGMDVTPAFLIKELREMKEAVKAGIAHNAHYGQSKVQQIRDRIYHLFDVVDGKVPGKKAEFTPPLEIMLGFRSRAHAKEILDNCAEIQVTYAPASGMADFIVDYRSASGKHYRGRVHNIIIGVFKGTKT